MTRTEQSEAEPSYTQAAALRDLVIWAQDRPPWQQDALFQLMGSREPADIDLARLEAICTEAQTEYNMPAASEGIVGTSAGAPVVLSEVHSVVGVNALVADQTLSLSPVGMTVIYGDNGSGKSGYCRILKHACRSRDDGFRIHPNIGGANDTPQSAHISFMADGVSQGLSWSPNGQQLPDLTSVSIFDSRSANTHVQQENAVAYTPFPMRVLEGLGELCDALKDRLDACVKRIEAQTPIALSSHHLRAETAAGRFLNGLNAKSEQEVLDALCALSDEDTRRLAALRSDLAQDPDEVLKKLEAQKARIERLRAAVAALETAVAEASVAELRGLRTALSDAEAASALASDALFAASPLPEVGSETWRALWEAARTFSNKAVYPTKVFPPASEEDALCVLCAQPLDAEAVSRWSTFEDFAKGATKAQEGRARAAFEEGKDKIAAGEITSDALSEHESFLRDELARSDVATLVLQRADTCHTRLRDLLDDRPVPEIIQPPCQAALDALANEFTARIDTASRMGDADGRQALQRELHELEDRVALNNLKADVAAQIERLAKIAQLREFLKSTSRTSVTNKNKELSERLVTGALRQRFAEEVAKFRLSAKPMELLKTRDRRAQSYFQVAFVGYPDSPLGDVLSEGEHRCVALAAFLAELATSQDASGIVFDDPMSSLDHIYRERVAGRLADEARHRQVVIFTHDLGFLFEVKREAEARDVTLHFQHVRRRGDAPGHVVSELPMKAKAAPELVSALRTELKGFKGQFDTVPDARRVIFAKGIIEQMREVWDQVIADFVAPVLGRFDNQIKGNSLFKLLVLTEADVKLTTEARGRLSEDLHNSARALNPNDVTHEQLVQEVDVLHKFIQDLTRRQKGAVLS